MSDSETTRATTADAVPPEVEAESIAPTFAGPGSYEGAASRGTTSSGPTSATEEAIETPASESPPSRAPAFAAPASSEDAVSQDPAPSDATGSLAPTEATEEEVVGAPTEDPTQTQLSEGAWRDKLAISYDWPN